MKTKKLDENTIEITETKEIVYKYQRSSIEQRIAETIERRNGLVEQLNNEIADLQAILAEMDKLEIVAKNNEI